MVALWSLRVCCLAWSRLICHFGTLSNRWCHRILSCDICGHLWTKFGCANALLCYPGIPSKECRSPSMGADDVDLSFLCPFSLLDDGPIMNEYRGLMHR
ncbi:hypothetical protein Nepgr_027729 [Nepenthes gracilis]|uniref:Secreted protein n=1 Tax=Nepenthes gracilis TaxID=150966 RepID=A0AAD3TB22_NEPGR|nr:hypothetical protein Nepgr_027729 [Nepenthes gracilis]